MSYFTNKTDAVEFVARALEASRRGYALTMTIGRDKSGDYFAHTVIDELSDATDWTVVPSSSSQLTTTLPVHTPVG